MVIEQLVKSSVAKPDKGCSIDEKTFPQNKKDL